METVTRIPIGDFPLGVEERAAIKRVVLSGRITEGREVHAFEDEFAEYMGTRHCVAVSSGTAALMVGLRALIVSEQYRIYEGARVLLPALTFVATPNAVTLAGMHPMWGDIDPETMCLSADAIEKGVGIFDIVLPVHLMGYGADIEGIKAKCDAHQPRPLLLVEDAAEAHGTTIGGKKAGTFGLWGAFSFYIAHTVQAGELGCIVTDSAEIAQVARQLKAHGRRCSCRICTRSTTGCPNLGNGDPRFQAQYIGWNFKAMEWSAALARVQLSHIEENMMARGLTRSLLRGDLEALVENELIEPFIRQAKSVPMAFPIILKRSGYRDRVVKELEERGVEARPLFGCVPTQQPAYAPEEITAKQVPVADRYGANGFYVGCHQYLTGEQIDRMAGIIRDVITEVVT